MSAIEEKRAGVDVDSHSDSEGDADFHDSDAFSDSSSDDEDAPQPRKGADKDLDSGDEMTISKSRKRRKGTGDANGEDLILTRAQKRTKYILASSMFNNLELMKKAQTSKQPRLRRTDKKTWMPSGVRSMPSLVRRSLRRQKLHAKKAQ